MPGIIDFLEEQKQKEQNTPPAQPGGVIGFLEAQKQAENNRLRLAATEELRRRELLTFLRRKKNKNITSPRLSPGMLLVFWKRRNRRTFSG